MSPMRKARQPAEAAGADRKESAGASRFESLQARQFFGGGGELLSRIPELNQECPR